VYIFSVTVLQGSYPFLNYVVEFFRKIISISFI